MSSFCSYLLELIFLLSFGFDSKAKPLSFFDSTWNGETKSVLRNWHFLGPFASGKNEIDGNPVESVGDRGLLDAIENRDIRLYSDIVEGGLVGWSKIQHVEAATGLTKISQGRWGKGKNVDWNSLYKALDPLSLEWQGSLVTAFYIAPAEVGMTTRFMFNCMGATGLELFSLKNAGASGVSSGSHFRLKNATWERIGLLSCDVYWKNNFNGISSINLREGWHMVHIRVRAKIESRIQCVVRKVPIIANAKQKTSVDSSNNFLSMDKPMFVPDILDGSFVGSLYSLNSSSMFPSSINQFRFTMIPISLHNPTCEPKEFSHFAIRFASEKNNQNYDESTVAENLGIKIFSPIFKKPLNGYQEIQAMLRTGTQHLPPTSSTAKLHGQLTHQKNIIYPYQTVRIPLYIAIIPSTNVSHKTNEWFTRVKVMELCQAFGNRIKITIDLIANQDKSVSTENGNLHTEINGNIDHTGEDKVNIAQNNSEYAKIHDSQSLTLECRFSNQSFVFTFVSSDGSIQHAAAIRPKWNNTNGKAVSILSQLEESKSDNNSSKDIQHTNFPTVIFLGGTGVTARSASDSHKWKPPFKSDANEYEFGINQMWLLTPERFGAHNWEGTCIWSILSCHCSYIQTSAAI